MISRDALRKYEGMEPEEIATAEGLEVLEVDDMPSQLEDIFCLGTIVIRRGLPAAERRGAALAHRPLPGASLPARGQAKAPRLQVPHLQRKRRERSGHLRRLSRGSTDIT